MIGGDSLKTTSAERWDLMLWTAPANGVPM
jgi:hypothetical protein